MRRFIFDIVYNNESFNETLPNGKQKVNSLVSIHLDMPIVRYGAGAPVTSYIGRGDIQMKKLLVAALALTTTIAAPTASVANNEWCKATIQVFNGNNAPRRDIRVKSVRFVDPDNGQTRWTDVHDKVVYNNRTNTWHNQVLRNALN
ncbi:MAG: hypothetical protein AAF701_01790, partial [Pseudomonadota bacterium]